MVKDCGFECEIFGNTGHAGWGCRHGCCDGDAGIYVTVVGNTRCKEREGSNFVVSNLSLVPRGVSDWPHSQVSLSNGSRQGSMGTRQVLIL